MRRQSAPAPHCSSKQSPCLAGSTARRNSSVLVTRVHLAPLLDALHTRCCLQTTQRRSRPEVIAMPEDSCQERAGDGGFGLTWAAGGRCKVHVTARALFADHSRGVTGHCG